MKKLIEKLAAATGNAKSPLQIPLSQWRAVDAAAAIPGLIDSDDIDANLLGYLCDCLFEEALDLTFSLYSYTQLQKFIKEDELFQDAIAHDWFVIGDRDGTMICVQVTEGTVCLIPAWSITEGQFTKEKRYKSLRTFVQGQIRHERQAAKEAASDDAEQVAKREQLAGLGDVNAADSEGRTQLMLAASDGDIDTVRDLLLRNADPNLAKKRTALFRAVQRRNAEMVALLIQHGADVTHSAHDVTPLQEASRCGTLDVVRTLVEAGADIHGQPPRTPLAIAVSDNDLPITQYLLDQGVDPNIVLENLGSHGPRTALSGATNNVEMVQLLLAHGADPRACPRILSVCITSGDISMIRCLLEAGAELDSTDLHRSRDPDIIAMLLEAGADANAISYHLTPLMHFARLTMACPKKERPPLIAIMRLLMEHGADVNRQDGMGNTALHLAMKENNGEGARAILEFKPDVTISNNSGEVAADLLPSVRPKALRLELQKAILG